MNPFNDNYTSPFDEMDALLGEIFREAPKPDPKPLAFPARTLHSVDLKAAFRVLARARNNQNLRYLGSAYIQREKPDLCKQLDHVANVQLPGELSS
ncbi:unnamed protein product [Dibothriocephalus latus]|uniref:Uncharacterized protein n=1 Tax=Dibothriocephalus latus TaxID=60516 RepID=A0A3P6T5Y1_DIBLA|nr:unnamed protein product [Dibothriocephalus latus]